MFDTWFASLSATEKSVTHTDNQIRKETYQLGIFFKKKKGIGTESKILFLFYEMASKLKKGKTLSEILCVYQMLGIYILWKEETCF